MPAQATDAAGDEQPWGWVVVWACFVTLAVIFGVSYAFAAFFDAFAREFDASRAQVSLVFGLSGLLYFTLGAGAGVLADRFGPRVVASAGIGCIALGLVAGSAATSMVQMTLAYGVGVGVGIALVYTPSIGCVQPWFTRRRGLAAGIASAGIGAGTLVVPLAVSAALALWPWRTAMQLLAATALALGLAATLLLKRAPVASARVRSAVPGLSLREALRSARFRWLYATTLLGAVPMFVPFAHLSVAARDLGVPDTQSVGLVGLIGIGSLTGRFVIGALADRFGRARTLTLGTAALGLSFAAWGAANGYAGLALFALLMGLSYGGIVSLLPALCMDFFGARAVTSTIGVLYTGAAFGNLAGPWMAGWAFDHFGDYRLVIATSLLCGLAASACAARAGRPEPAPLAPRPRPP